MVPLALHVQGHQGHKAGHLNNIKLVKKTITCIIKSMSRARPAYKAKARTAGIPERAPAQGVTVQRNKPRKKQVDSVAELRSIEGATDPTTRPTCSA